ncbi:MAG: membrane protein insertion efficiency factor YidD [Clostridia bacterium]
MPAKFEIFLIKLYKKYLSPALGRRCVYYPTCSEYTRQAVDKYGIIKGNVLGIIRILKCNPFSHGGVDHLK